MAHAVSLAYARSDHMSPLAVAMTTALHVSVAAALWWISPLNHIDTTPDPIEVTVEVPPPTPPPETPQPAPVPQPSPPPAAAQPVQPSPPPAPPMRLGLAPSGTSTDPKATPGAQQPSPPQPNAASTEAAKPEPDKAETPKTETPKADPPKVEQRQALATPPPPPPPPAPELENALPPLEAPPPPVTSREIPRPAPPPPAPKPPPPAQHAQPTPPPPPQRPPQQQALQSSPLSHLPPPRTNEQQQAARQAPAFVNPADMAGQKRIEDQYLWTVSNKLSQHAQFVRNITTEQGTVVLRLVIARDGRLVDATISRSSGVPSLDSVSLNMVRQAGPYQPLPDALLGASHVFILPLYFRRNE